MGVWMVQQRCVKGEVGGWVCFVEGGDNCFAVETFGRRQTQGRFRRCAVPENNHWAVAGTPSVLVTVQGGKYEPIEGTGVNTFPETVMVAGEKYPI